MEKVKIDEDVAGSRAGGGLVEKVKIDEEEADRRGRGVVEKVKIDSTNEKSWVGGGRRRARDGSRSRGRVPGSKRFNEGGSVQEPPPGERAKAARDRVPSGRWRRGSPALFLEAICLWEAICLSIFAC